MKKYLFLLPLLLFLRYGIAQEQVDFSSYSLSPQTEYKYVDKFCKLLKEKKGTVEITNMGQISRFIYGRRIVVKWIQNERNDFSMKLHDYYIMKLYYDSFLECNEFLEYYYLAIDNDTNGNVDLIKQHISASKKLKELLNSSFDNKLEFGRIIELSQRLKPIVFGEMKHIYKNEYKFVLYHLNTDGDVRLPYDDKNIIADIRFSYSDGKLKKLKYNEEKDKVSVLIRQLETQLQDSNAAPPPPPPPPPPSFNKR